MEFKPIIDWIKVALTRESVGRPLRLVAPSLTAPLTSRTLMEHQWTLVLHDIPALNLTASKERKDQIVVELGALVDIQQEAADDTRREKRRKEENMPSKVFGGQIANVMRLCQAATKADLPPVWLELTLTSTKQRMSIIQKFVDATSDDIADGLPIIITSTLVNNITTLEFVMRNM